MLGNCFLSSRLIFKPSHQSTAAGSLLFYLMDDRRAATPATQGLDFVLSPVYWEDKVNTVKRPFLGLTPPYHRLTERNSDIHFGLYTFPATVKWNVLMQLALF